jgi:SpoVK/Ycf46/Vps4 family AAA+-type ATPase
VESSKRLDELAQRINSSATMKDLVLPEVSRQQLHDVVSGVHRQQKIYKIYWLGSHVSKGLGTITVLFTGPDAKGKTIATEVIANELHLDLYRIDLSQVVGKYIGETEKNLRCIFDAAEHSGAILFFDEGDALFGKRSEVKDSHERYANTEVSYLLQRFEAHQGLAILSTNKKDTIEEPFLRRFRFVVHFPSPNCKCLTK